MASCRQPYALPRAPVKRCAVSSAKHSKKLKLDPHTKTPDAHIIGSIFLSEQRRVDHTVKKKKSVTFSTAPATPRKPAQEHFTAKKQHPVTRTSAPATPVRSKLSFASHVKKMSVSVKKSAKKSLSTTHTYPVSHPKMSKKLHEERSCHKNAVLNQWSEDAMQQAMAYFNDTRSMSTPPSIAEIARKYRIPHVTLWKQVTGLVGGTGHKSGGKHQPKVFPTEDEDELADLIRKYAASSFAMTVEDMKCIANEITKDRGYSGFNEETEMAGRKWMSSFVKRNPDLKLKDAKDISIYRSFSANPSTINKWFDLFEKILQDNDITGPKKIWNCNETGLQDVPEKRKVIGVSGLPAYLKVPADKGETSTILTCGNAVGNMMEPVVIQHGMRVQQSWR